MSWCSAERGQSVAQCSYCDNPSQAVLISRITFLREEASLYVSQDEKLSPTTPGCVYAAEEAGMSQLYAANSIIYSHNNSKKNWGLLNDRYCFQDSVSTCVTYSCITCRLEKTKIFICSCCSVCGDGQKKKTALQRLTI